MRASARDWPSCANAWAREAPAGAPRKKSLECCENNGAPGSRNQKPETRNQKGQAPVRGSFWFLVSGFWFREPALRIVHESPETPLPLSDPLQGLGRRRLRLDDHLRGNADG